MLKLDLIQIMNQIRPLPKKKVIELKVETYTYLIDDGSLDKKAKIIKKCVIKRKLKFEIYKNCLEATQLNK